MVDATLSKFGHPATLIGEAGPWTVLLRPQQVTLGSLVLVCREDVTCFGDASPAAFAALHGAVGRTERMLREAVTFEKINYLMLMMVDPAVHFHVIPRYDGERVLDGRAFPDAGWPGPPALGQAVEPDAALLDAILARLRAAWAAAA